MSRTPTNGSDDPVEKDDGEANVSCSPPQDEMVVRDLTPVGCEDTHGHVVSCMTPNNDHTIVGGHPADPGEARENDKEMR